MIPTQAVFERMMELLGADTATLNTTGSPTDAKVGLFINDFAPNAAMVLADLTEATFDGYVQIPADGHPHPQSLDPSNGNSRVTLLPSAGGWHWETTGLTDLPQTVFGYFVIGHGVLLNLAKRFETPIVLTGANQSIDIQRIGMQQSFNSLT